jgi:hypothetical protein
MQATPLFLGACALASIAGVVSGTAIDTNPIQRGGIGLEEIARPAIDFASDGGLSDQVALPDHYAINTPDGRFDVPELSSRGIYAQQRFAWRDAQYTPPPEPAFAEPPQTEPIDDGLGNAGRADEAAQAAVPSAADDQPIAPTQGEARLIQIDGAVADS